MRYSNYKLDGHFTQVVYSFIYNGQYKDAIEILLSQSHAKNSRATLSLLAYCYFKIEDYVNSSIYYEKLSKAFPDVVDYSFYYSYSLYLSGEVEASFCALSQVKSENAMISKLKAMIYYEFGDFVTSRQTLEQAEKDEDVIAGLAVLDYSEGNFEAAHVKLESIPQDDPVVVYALAVTNYQLKEREEASVGAGRLLENVEGDWRNAKCRQRNCLAEALTLRSALALEAGDEAGAREYLRTLEPADDYTCHNLAVLSGDPTSLASLHLAAPPPALSNLLILCLRLGLPEMAADHLAYQPKGPLPENVRRLRPLVEALVAAKESVQEAQRYLEEAAKRPAEILQRAARLADQARNNDDPTAAASAIVDYERALAEFLPLAICRAKVFWDAGDWEQAELSLHGATEFCSESDTYRVLVGNALFMQDKFAEAAAFYEAAVERAESLLAVNPLVLAHLCVALVMSSQNDRAENTMRRIEAEEEATRNSDPNTKVFHLSLVNLVIGTLYCTKRNFEFGINRLISSMEPFERKLGTDTWFHSKRCLLWLAESVAKGFFQPSDNFKGECLKFIEKCAAHGNRIQASLDPVLGNNIIHEGKNTVTYEARQIKAILHKLFDA